MNDCKHKGERLPLSDWMSMDVRGVLDGAKLANPNLDWTEVDSWFVILVECAECRQTGLLQRFVRSSDSRIIYQAMRWRETVAADIVSQAFFGAACDLARNFPATPEGSIID